MGRDILMLPGVKEYTTLEAYMADIRLLVVEAENMGGKESSEVE